MADVDLTITIPDAYVTRAIEAFTGIAGKRIDMMCHGEDFNANWDFIISPQGGGETLKDFGERFFRELGLAVIRMWDYAEDRERYNAAVALIPKVEEDVPPDILQ